MVARGRPELTATTFHRLKLPSLQKYTRSRPSLVIQPENFRTANLALTPFSSSAW
jgi:hypothetical protein